MADLTELSRIIQQATTGLANDALVTRGAGWLQQFKREFPIAHAIIIGMLYKKPEDVMDSLLLWVPDLQPYRRHPQALEYIKRLQVRLGNKETV